jgi:tetratricopeptide (TPR) repeat protein/predicted Ser/Thr protein kinase
MPYATDGLVGKLALQKGWINADQLKDALAEQEGSERGGARRPLGVLLVSRGALSEERLVALLEEQKKVLEAAAADARLRREDHLFGQILIKQGAASEEQIHKALRRQAEAAERGEIPVPRLGQILMEMGISAPDVQSTLKLQTKALYGCPGCGLRYNIKDHDAQKRYRCRKCGTLLVGLPSAGDQRADASAYGMNLEVAEKLPPEVAQAELDPVNRFDKYVLLETLGAGGSGTVFRAFQKDLRRVVALKVLRGTDDEMLQRFAREAQTAARLKHPGIVSVYETGRVDGVPYLSMEYIDGKPLDRLGALPPRRVASLLRDVALAVQHAHDQGVLHRDLKPQNILVDAAGRACVTDFGLAREIEGGKSLTLTGMVVGTPAYMSPEQARGEKDLDGRSDVSGLGAVLYELLAGRPPFAGQTPVDTALAVINQDPVPPRRLKPDVPADLEAVCLKAMEKDRERRYPSARALAEDLQRYSEGEPVQAVRPTVVTRAVARLGRHKLRTAAVAAAFLSAALVVALLVAVMRESRVNRDLLRAASLEKAGDLEGALAVYRRHPSADTDVQRLRAALEKLRQDQRRAEAERLVAASQPPAAPDRRVEQATRALELWPGLESAFAARAFAHLEAGRDAAAYEDLGRAADQAGERSLPHWMARAEIARRRGRIDDEVADLGRALGVSPLSGDLRALRAAAQARAARSYLEAGDAPRAARRILAAEEDVEAAGAAGHAPLQDVEAFLARSPAAFRRSLAAAFTDEALSACPAPPAVRRASARAVACDPAFAPALSARGLGAFLLERDADALADAERALDLLPSLPEALAVRGLARARLALRTADVEGAADAVRDVETFLENAAPRPSLRALRTYAEAFRPAWPEERRGAFAAALTARAGALRRKGDAACAVRLLGRAVDLDPRHGAAYAMRGELRYDAEEYASAAEDWARAGALDPALRASLEARLRDARARLGG